MLIILMCKVSALQCTSAFLTDEVDDNGRGRFHLTFLTQRKSRPVHISDTVPDLKALPGAQMFRR